MVFNLIVEIPYLAVELFFKCNYFYYHVWYGRACLGVKSLHIYHSVVFPDYGDDTTHTYLSVESRIHINIVDLYHPTCPA